MSNLDLHEVRIAKILQRSDHIGEKIIRVLILSKFQCSLILKKIISLLKCFTRN